MDLKHRSSSFNGGGYQDEPQSSSEQGGAESPVSGEDSRATATALSTKKGRRAIQKRVVSVRIGDVEGSRSGGGRGETYPPSDSWAWRKYGQKPIKGSPFPRGYYRCSSSKGCPARKQVERSHVDPTMLVVTYAGDHNHSVPATKNSAAPAASFPAAPAVPSSPETPPTPPRPASPESNANADVEEDHREMFSCAVEFGLGGDDALVNFSWLSDVAIEGPCFVGPRCDDADMALVSLSMREEDELLFADLDELPECSAVFRRGRGISTCDLGATSVSAPLCSRTG